MYSITIISTVNYTFLFSLRLNLLSDACGSVCVYIILATTSFLVPVTYTPECKQQKAESLWTLVQFYPRRKHSPSVCSLLPYLAIYPSISSSSFGSIFHLLFVSLQGAGIQIRSACIRLKENACNHVVQHEQ